MPQVWRLSSGVTALVAIVLADAIMRILNMLFRNVIMRRLNILFRVTLSCRNVFGILILGPRFVHGIYMSCQASLSVCRIFAVLTLVTQTLWQYVWVGWVYFHFWKIINVASAPDDAAFPSEILGITEGGEALVNITPSLIRLTANNVTVVVAVADRIVADASYVSEIYELITWINSSML